MLLPRSIGALAVCLAAGQAACTSDVPPAGPDGGVVAGELALGGASDDGNGFVALDDGDDVTLIGGAQGGFHLWTGFKMRGMMGEVRIEREARRMSDDALVLRAPTQVLEVPEDAMEAWWERPEAVPSFMCPAPVGIRVYDEPLRLYVEVADEDGVVMATDELVVIPRCPEGELNAFCLSICDG